MEHSEFRSWAESEGVLLDEEQAILLLDFAGMIDAANKQFNLTGCKTIQEILADLILGSISPFSGDTVPRGTVFVDIGTGAGIPGVPLGVVHRHWRGVLIDSNGKKVDFINRVIQACRIRNLVARQGRAEELAHGDLRETFDLAVSRAMGDPFFLIETGAPLIKAGGLLYLYSHHGPGTISDRTMDHAAKLSVSLVTKSRYAEYGISETGLLFLKTGITSPRYPRRMAVIKRDLKFLAGRGTLS